MSLTDRINSRSGNVQHQQFEVLQRYCWELEEENRRYRNCLANERKRNEDLKETFVEDWYYVKRELYNFIKLTQAITATDMMESPLLKNIVKFDRTMIEFTTPLESGNDGGDIHEIAPTTVKRPYKVSLANRSRAGISQQRSSQLSSGAEQDALREILRLWK